ncbi:protein pellino-like isoform X3 [Leptotrombidium deliense]|uniref:Protein pellino-like isoform X3 n=1 Tax=Leptotrombidium deliense TaxID=299467 RepID=A0A443SIU9_9ACAR|nr:protein pellino-like isoform X3 [Leptotrombidium deliense]
MGKSLIAETDSGPSSINERRTGVESHSSAVSSQLLQRNNYPVIFGELVILGYNGFLPQGEKGRRKSKYILYRRPYANGIKKSKHYTVKQPQQTKAIQDKGQHSISYTLSRNQAVIVEYMIDEETDMFQIGRSSESPIDFVVIDTPTADKTESSAQQSTISRFACRILIDRSPPYTARIFAAGFDSSRNIFLGEKATKWQHNGEIDGLTTNGILLMNPKGSFCGNVAYVPDSNKGEEKCCMWREVSVCGGVYAIRETRSASQKGARIENETNILVDGTLIDLCGATLLWRSAEGLKYSPTKKQLEEMIDDLNAARPQCPVGLNTLVIPRKLATLSESDKQPYVYLKCGHVQGLHDWGQNKTTNARTCPMCLSVGPVVKLSVGMEPSFYVDCASPDFAFNPCGHMASERTVRFWSSIAIPHGTNGFHSMCPFCGVPLQGDLGFVRLIFQDHVD